MNAKRKTDKVGGLELVMLRNMFYRDSYRRALMALLLLIAVNVVLAGVVVFLEFTPPKPQYFPTTADGRIIHWHPLNDPVVTDNFVLQWAANAVRQAFSLDFIHWRSQLQTASGDFTPSGWKYFLQSLKSSNNLTTLTQLKMVSNATITGAPQLLEKEVISGVFAWKIKVPILVTYTNAARTIPLPLMVTLIVLRVPVQQSAARIAINNFLPVPRKTTQSELEGSGAI